MSKSWQPNDYAFILDAGSSGTRLYVYEWRRWRVGDYGQPEINNPYSYKPTPPSGISKTVQGLKDSYKTVLSLEARNHADAPGAAGAVMALLQSKVNAHLGPIFLEAHKFAENAGLIAAQIPLFLLGTAGIRDLKSDSTDPDETERTRNRQYRDLLRCMRHSAENAGFNFKESGAISGEAEALYGWIAGNYTLNDSSNWLSPSPGPFGYAEMGGASAQIAFSPSRAVAERPYDGVIWKVKLGSAEFELFLGSYPLGMDLGIKSYFDKLIANHRAEVENGRRINDDDLSDEQKIVIDPGKPFGLEKKVGIWTLKGYEFVGINASKLTTTVREAMESALGHHYSIFPSSLEPAIKAHKFIGGANFWYSTRTIFGLDKVGNPKTTAFSYVEFRKEVYQTLHIPWDEVQAKFPSDSYKLGDAWIRAMWAERVLSVQFRLGFTNAEAEDVDKLTFRPFNGFEGADLTWTLGKLVHFITGNQPPEQVPASADQRGVPYRAFLDNGDN